MIRGRRQVKIFTVKTWPMAREIGYEAIDDVAMRSIIKQFAGADIYCHQFEISDDVVSL